MALFVNNILLGGFSAKLLRGIKHEKVLIGLTLLSLSSAIWADGKSDCALSAGSYLTGVVITNPTYVPGKVVKGKQLSHTHLTLKADQDNRSYDVAMDNVFASGYDKAGRQVPAPLNTIKKQDRLELCGQLYTSGVGIHWVHTNCGVTPRPDKPEGWVKKLDTMGNEGPNMEASTEYCAVFGNN